VSQLQHATGEGLEQTFISHLVELRDRLIRAGIAVIVVFLGLVYWAPEIFRLLVRPLMMNLPKDGKLIVTDVTGSFFVPMKVTMLVAFVIALPYVLYRSLPKREEAGRAVCRNQLHVVPLRNGVCLFRCVPNYFSRHGALQCAVGRGNEHRRR